MKIKAPNYDLALTLQSGQTFRWIRSGDGWEGVIGRRWVRLTQNADVILAETEENAEDEPWLTHYLQSEVALEAILATFPNDPPMQASLRACRGLRLLRQDPWECLASFLLSSCKQITQIQGIVASLCARYGEPVAAPPRALLSHAFPTARRLAQCSESELRECKMGWRAPALKEVADRVASGRFDLNGLRELSLEEARNALIELPGVGPKIANCVLLFAYGFATAFPVDVWVAKAIRQLYFPRRPPRPERWRQFVSTHFGPHAGYAQQYLFHYMRTIHHDRIPAESAHSS